MNAEQLKIYDALGSLYIHAFRLARDNKQLIGENARVVGERVIADAVYITLEQLWDLIEKELESKGIQKGIDYEAKQK